MKLTPIELRELDAWIAENVMGVIIVKVRCRDKSEVICPDVKRYTTDPAAAMEVLKKCGYKIQGRDYPRGFGHYFVRVYFAEIAHEWCVCLGNEKSDSSIYGQAETLEIAICLFAKKLFTE